MLLSVHSDTSEEIKRAKEILERTGLRAALAWMRIAVAPEGAIASHDLIEVMRRRDIARTSLTDEVMRGAGETRLPVSQAYARAYAMNPERHVKLFRNGRNQAVRIPREFELPGEDAIMRKDGDRLIIEPERKKTLRQVLASLEPLDEEFPEVPELPLDSVEI